MIVFRITLLVAAFALAAHADFSYSVTRKGGPGPESTTKHYFKGQKMKTESAAIASIFDFEAQTVTTINHGAKTYSVASFKDLGRSTRAITADVKVDIRETGQHKNINGFNAVEAVMTMQMNNAKDGKAGGPSVLEMTLWLSADVPGAMELRTFYQRNMDKFPWHALGGNGAAGGLQQAMSDMQRKAAQMGGVPVLEVIRMKAAGGPTPAAQMQPGAAQARAQLEALRKQGGPQAQAAELALARMDAAGGATGNTLFEMTMESGAFSTATIDDAVFAPPAGYQKK